MELSGDTAPDGGRQSSGSYHRTGRLLVGESVPSGSGVRLTHHHLRGGQARQEVVTARCWHQQSAHVGSHSCSTRCYIHHDSQVSVRYD